MENNTKLMNQAFSRLKALTQEQFMYYYQQYQEIQAIENRTTEDEREATILEGKFLAFDEMYAHINRMKDLMQSENR